MLLRTSIRGSIFLKKRIVVWNPTHLVHLHKEIRGAPDYGNLKDAWNDTSSRFDHPIQIIGIFMNASIKRGEHKFVDNSAHLINFIADYEIIEEYWVDLIDLLGKYSDKVKRGEPFIGRDIQLELCAIIDLPMNSAASFNCLKHFLQATHLDGINRNVAEYIKGREIPSLDFSK